MIFCSVILLSWLLMFNPVKLQTPNQIAASLSVECPCLVEIEDNPSTKVMSTGLLHNCWTFCLTEADCMVFSINVLKKECKLYDRYQVGPDMSVIKRRRGCKSLNKFDSVRWFYFSVLANPPTTTCATRQQNNPGAPSESTYLYIRGMSIPVYCNMSVTPAKTYLEIPVISRWGDGFQGKKPSWVLERQWSKVEIKYDECLQYIESYNNDDHVTEMAQVPTSNLHDYWERSRGVGWAGDCGNSEGYSSIPNLPSVFMFPSNLDFSFSGAGSRWEDEISFTPDRKAYSYKIYGYCGWGYPKDKFGGGINFLPLIFTSR